MTIKSTIVMVGVYSAIRFGVGRLIGVNPTFQEAVLVIAAVGFAVWASEKFEQ